MNPAQLPMALLAFAIAAISLCWIRITLKEGRQALEKIKKP